MEVIENHISIRAARVSITVPDFKEGHEELEELLLFLRSKGYEGVRGITEVPPDGRGNINIELVKGVSPNEEFSRELDRILANLERQRILKKMKEEDE